MKKLCWIIVFIYSLSAYTDLKAYDTTAANYMPLKAGNIWVYYGCRVLGGGIMHCSYNERFLITGTTIFQNKTYFRMHAAINELSGNSTGCANNYVASRLFKDTLLRMDSSTNNLYGMDQCLIDSLASQRGDSIRLCLWPFSEYCDTGTIEVFGVNILAKAFLNDGPEQGEQMIYVKGIGLCRYSWMYPGPSYEYIILQGCVINGVVYGDTSFIVGINQFNSEIPKTFSLSQNYPNPFNPTTKIKFDIPNTVGVAYMRPVQINLYDILGRKVATLVNENLKPGEYETEWDASNFASGVYFYQLEAGTFIESKKMILIR